MTTPDADATTIHTFDLLSSIQQYDALVAQLSSSSSTPSRATYEQTHQLWLCTHLWLEADAADEERLLNAEQRHTLRTTRQNCSILMEQMEHILTQEEMDSIQNTSSVPSPSSMQDFAMEYRGLGKYHWVCVPESSSVSMGGEAIDLSNVDLAAEEAELMDMANKQIILPKERRTATRRTTPK